MTRTLDEKKEAATKWFAELRDMICAEFETIELEGGAGTSEAPAGKFERKIWDRQDHSGADGGGGTMSVMHGRVFEKVGVNISAVHGEFSPEFRKEIPGADENPEFWAAGISIVAHMSSPLVPAVHMNTRFISTSKSWFGGGTDLTPMLADEAAAEEFHASLKDVCDAHDDAYYEKFKKWCDEYFYLPHREEPRGIGGIFYDYVDSGDWEADFTFTQNVGRAFLNTYPSIIRARKDWAWTEDQREQQLIKRGRYVEFNLLHDRGTKFGLKTGGNVEAILMSMPPIAKWP
ncbi:MAG: oxygen-dependent coproporphyrinogen oxidase [Alphaproteobacteria bacterium]|jgi:coproporphyrinogen III oxidase